MPERFPRPLTHEQVLSLAKGEATLRHGGTTLIPHKLSKQEWSAFYRARLHGYVSWTTPRTRYNLFNTWFMWCEASDDPYIRIYRGPKWSDVEYDFIAWTRELSATGIEKMVSLWRALKGEGRARWWTIPGPVMGIFRVKTENADQTARDILSVIRADGSTVDRYRADVGAGHGE